MSDQKDQGAPGAKTGPAAGTRSTAAKAPAAASSSSGAAAAASSSGAGGQEGDEPDEDVEPMEQEDAEAPQALGSDGDDAAAIRKEMQAMRDEIKRLKQAQQPPQQQSLSLGAPSSSSSSAPPPAAVANGAGQAPQQQTATIADLAELFKIMQEGQARQASQQLVLRSLGELPSFSGKGADTTLIAQEWLQRAERYFAVREQASGMGAAQDDQARLLTAAYALQDDARRWYDALPQPPSSWAGFRDAVKARFCSVPGERIRLDRLREFVEKAHRMRDKLNVQGMQAFTARFAQMAGEVSARFLTDHGQLELLARGLPLRYAEVVAKEDAKEPPPLLHDVINLVLARASQKEQVASYGGASSSPASAAPIGLDAIALAAATFGLTREEASQYVADSEGWVPYDTHDGSQPQQGGAGAGPASKVSPPPTSSSDDKLDRILSALATHAKVGAGPAARDRNNSRRNPPSGVMKDIPPDLVKARQEADLCIKCGVAKYEPGGKGHNSRTCKAAADKTTSVAEGRKKAGF
jgi:hypothetical protein